jgi:2-polyprenyl-3-methyl-5-hydroxy-6-metoxy-1,4-benzoquinol methylase
MSYTPNANSPLRRTKDNGYFENRREDVIGVIREQKLTAARVLELGCAAGVTGEALKPMLGTNFYVGIDSSEKAAEAARRRFDQVHVTDLNAAMPEDLGLQDQQFDLLLAMDVLEHLYDPWDVVARWASLLVPGGHVVVSMPNAQNIAVIERLVTGRFEYERDGLLDATHIRFFTFKTLMDLLTGAGLEIVIVHSVQGPQTDPAKLRPEGNLVTLAKVALRNQTREEILRICTFQYIVVARRPA